MMSDASNKLCFVLDSHYVSSGLSTSFVTDQSDKLIFSI